MPKIEDLPKPTEAELGILNVLWERGPSTVRDVHESLYRDEGDTFVTATYDFTPDVEAFRTALADVVADGGGDYPEALDEGLAEAASEIRAGVDQPRDIAAAVSNLRPADIERSSVNLRSAWLEKERAERLANLPPSGPKK